MPELPEVQTTVSSLQKVLPKKFILDVWTDLAIQNQRVPHFKETLKDGSFFKKFKKLVTSTQVKKVERRAKNILIHLSNGYTILIHMKMTGHLLYGIYSVQETKNGKLRTRNWKPLTPEGLRDPFNRFIHVVFTLSNGKYLALCDSRKFAKVTLLPTKEIFKSKHLKQLGPEPLDKAFTYTTFTKRLATKPTGRIKTVLMDQSVISGIGNIYSDEALWLTNIHPERRISTLLDNELKNLYRSIKKVLTQGIHFGGDSTSDYRNIDGLPGKFNHHHNAYRLTGKKCGKRGCRGVILRKAIGGRSAHFCSIHQKLSSPTSH